MNRLPLYSRVVCGSVGIDLDSQSCDVKQRGLIAKDWALAQ